VERGEVPGVVVEKHSGKRPLGRPKVRGSIILKYISTNKMGGHELD
jgi:hypothetical protein